MLSNYWKVIGTSVALMIIFSTFMILIIAYIGIDDPHARIITGKILSLFALAAFGQSEALKIYLHNNQQKNISILGVLNKIGVALTIGIALLLMLKIYEIEHNRIGGSFDSLEVIMVILDNIIHGILKHSEIVSLVPLLIFAVINLLLWTNGEGGEEIGRVCFVVSDIPVLLPMVGAIALISMIESYGSTSYKLLVGGATVMLIFSSIILTECTKGLLYRDLEHK
uniref:Uncharacterized protein n=1 Tax=Candidatus Kentrum sp. MB TaxID=2138164 RepID=A0A450XM46_9GAMM|nr:MAG: hypothetical protein BECKMB1821I_GA0114274_101534 [Candidatus Kentron sp. MB]VFK75201.1 MAG: hypothetical protein BECKMB1821H_GA0114242_101734 [Candidatus Kentron sp. MB]